MGKYREAFQVFKEYHNANHHDGINHFDDEIYKKSNGDDFDSEYVQECHDHFMAGWQEQQKRIDELNQENQKLALSNTGYHNASASYLCKLMQIQFVLNQQIKIAKSKREDGEVFEDKTETKIADYLDDYNIALDKILGDEATQEKFNAYAKANEFLKQKARADKNQKRIDELQAEFDELRSIATELAEYASYAEIIGGVTVNRAAVRGFCDKVYDFNRKFDDRDPEQVLKGGEA